MFIFKFPEVEKWAAILDIHSTIRMINCVSKIVKDKWQNNLVWETLFGINLEINKNVKLWVLEQFWCFQLYI